MVHGPGRAITHGTDHIGSRLLSTYQEQYHSDITRAGNRWGEGGESWEWESS